MKAVSRRRYIIDGFILILVIIVGFVAVRNAYAIGDWWFFMRNNPTPETEAIADQAYMTEKGERLFLRFAPELLDQTGVSRECGAKLGCTVGQKIYILKGTSKTQADTATVTAAHEMLHVAYSRLSNDDKAYIDQLLETAIQDPKYESVANKLDGYKSEDRINEAHSFLGTEATELNPELETYYAQYFSDRAALVRLYQATPAE